MKIHLNRSELNKLNIKSLQTLEDWYFKKYNSKLEVLFLGEIIDFLTDHNKYFEIYFTKDTEPKTLKTMYTVDIDMDKTTVCTEKKELIDVLLGAVKKTLKAINEKSKTNKN